MPVLRQQHDAVETLRGACRRCVREIQNHLWRHGVVRAARQIAPNPAKLVSGLHLIGASRHCGVVQDTIAVLQTRRQDFEPARRVQQIERAVAKRISQCHRRNGEEFVAFDVGAGAGGTLGNERTAIGRDLSRRAQINVRWHISESLQQIHRAFHCT